MLLDRQRAFDDWAANLPPECRKEKDAKARRRAWRAVVATWQPSTSAEEWEARAKNFHRRQYGVDPLTLWLIGLLISIAIQFLIAWWRNRHPEQAAKEAADWAKEERESEPDAER